MHKKVLVVIADNIEEIEAIAPVDLLRRAGAEVTLTSISNLNITATHGVKLVADKLLKDCVSEIYDLIVLPGGMPGAEHLRDCPELIAMLKKQQQAGRFCAAICASPVVVLQYHGLLEDVRATCHPALFDQLHNGINERVVVDRNFITSQGPGTAIEFSLKLVELLFDQAKVEQLKVALVT